MFAASSVGKGHIDVGKPCQDAFSFSIKNGRLVAVVCDGAGSATHSELGAKSSAIEIARFLSDQVEAISTTTERDIVERAVETARSTIQRVAAELNVPAKEFSCTLVGAVIHADGGFLFHIGDGVGVAELENLPPIVSFPENGEYANETYFLTAEDWVSHLKIDHFIGRISCLALMSDGTMPFAFKRTELHGPFMNPVKLYLASVSEQQGSEALEATLANEATWKITNDDKTLLVVLPGKE